MGFVVNMETTIDVTEASEQFPTIVDRVQYQKDRYVVSPGLAGANRPSPWFRLKSMKTGNSTGNGCSI
jgi:hypothetical protein